MARKISLSDRQYEPDICGAVDFGFFEDDNDVERTKGSSAIVTNSVVVSSYDQQHLPLIESDSHVLGAKCLVDSRFLEDTSCGRLWLREQEEASRRCLIEGRQESGEAMRNEDRASFGSSNSDRGKIGSTSSLEAHDPYPIEGDNVDEARGAVMEHVDPHPYSSDEWEESDLSDSDGDDHSDSSDDDDPKSQVDRLIERGTLIYMDGENSNLSSETESSDYDDSDSESDITDVSPLISATASPLGLSPVLPRRTLGTSPLALHNNRGLVVDRYMPEITSNDQGYDSQPQCNGSSHSNSDDSTDMTLLLKAVVELEKKQKRHQQNNHNISNEHYNNRHHHHHKNYENSRHHQNNLHNHQHHQPTSPVTIHPIDASPHHRHLRRAAHSHRRKNMSFSNDEVRRIDRENQILLHKIVSAHTRTNNQSSSNQNNRSVQRPANSTVNRKREEEKIRRENVILLRKIQEAKPSRDITASRSPRHRTAQGVRPPSSLPATPGSCGASAGTI
ncbi:hypothetical protein SK128_015666 [Halocaridina rubra]|uniref:Cilia- and flagella-associated protein 97 n=1 Tax=Halocaridina rubra TaxID=373956 RepID=A0AAN8ZVJ7_HALRR